MKRNSLTILLALTGTLLLAACGRSEDDNQVGTSVALTVAAISGNATPIAAPPTPPVVSTPTTLPAATQPPALPTQPPTLPAQPPPPTATQLARVPPELDNVAVGGENFPADHVSGEVIVDPIFLIRMAVRDSNFFATEGDVDGAGIAYVDFFVSDANGFPVYERREEFAGYCIFAGGEPDCNPWPVNAAGQYTWGEGGPPVQSGDYQFNINVFSKAPDADPDFFGVWNWNFTMTVTVP
jgi:hypothetical protein